MSDVFRFFRHCSYSSGELARIRPMLRESGTALMLPYDQFIEHDIRHLEADSDSGNPDYILELAKEGGYNAVAIHYGLAKRYWTKTEGEVPLLLKISGKTGIPSQSKALSVHTSFVEDAVRLGASAIGYTMYYGSPRECDDIPQLASIRRACDRYGMPLVVWAYPRGEAVDAKGGRDTSYILESAARMAMEMGASIIKSNLPKASDADFLVNESVPAYARDVERMLQDISDGRVQKFSRAKRVVEAAQGVPVLFSGGSKTSDEDLIEKAEVCVEAGGFGFIFGRNMWKREKKDALAISKRLQKILDTKANPLFGNEMASYDRKEKGLRSVPGILHSESEISVH